MNLLLLNRVWKWVLLLASVLAAAAGARGGTPVLFSVRDFQSAPSSAGLTIKPENNPIFYGTNIHGSEPIETNLAGGLIVVELVPNDYLVTIEGVPKAFEISVYATNVVKNAVDLMKRGTTYLYTNRVPGVMQLTSSNGSVTISPGNGQGVVDLAATGISASYITGLSNEFNIFNAIASNTVAACTTPIVGGFSAFGTAHVGTNIFVPSGDSTYRNFVIRDCAMAVRSAPWLFTAQDITNFITVSMYMQGGSDNLDAGFVDSMATGGALNPSPNSSVDSIYDVVDLIYSHYKKTGLTGAWSQNGAAITNAFSYVSVSNHLVYVQPDINGDAQVGWGFRDFSSLASSGDNGTNLICSLFRYRAYKEISEMYGAMGLSAAAIAYTNELPLIITNLTTYLWVGGQTNLFRKSSMNGSGPGIPGMDIPGSAYYVVLVGGSPANKSDAISRQLCAMMPGNSEAAAGRSMVQNGQVNTLMRNDPAFTGAYQFGGYWGCLSAWVAQAMRRTSTFEPTRLMKSLAGRYEATPTSVVPYEHESQLGATGGNAPAGQYGVSATMPLQYFSTDFSR